MVRVMRGRRKGLLIGTANDLPWRRFVRFLTLALAAGVFLAADSPATACPDVAFLGAAGSGQRDTNAEIEKFNGVGPEVNEIAGAMRRELKGSSLSMALIPISYPAKSTDIAQPTKAEIAATTVGGPAVAAAALANYAVRLSGYFASINEGVVAALVQARYLLDGCGSTRIVFAGYSQGAMVAHRAERALVNQGDFATVSHVAGTVLLADGDRVARSQARSFGTSGDDGRGVYSYVNRLNKDVVFPGSTANICDHQDLVCDFGLKSILNFSQAKRIHQSYSDEVIDRAAKWVAGKVAESTNRVIFDGSPRFGPPPAHLGPYRMRPFGADGRGSGMVTGVRGPTGRIEFPRALDHQLVGEGWQTWSHGYQGDVYMSNDGSHRASIKLPEGTRAFYLYAEPDQFADYDVEAVTNTGSSSGPITVYGDSGAKYFGFYTVGDARLSRVTVTAGDNLAVGEFGIAGR